MHELYITYITSLGIFAILASLFGIRRKVKPFLYAMILWRLLLWLLYFFILSPQWVLANGDLMYMYKVYERTIDNGHYPFNDLELIRIRPNYVYYPTPFMIQAVLSIIMGADPKLLMYVPLAMFCVYIVVVALTILVLKRVSTLLRPLVLAPLFSFIGIYVTSYFIYSHVSRALIFLILYYVICRSTKNSAKDLLILTLLSVAVVLGHSQEPITFLLLLVIFVSVQQFLGVLFKYGVDKNFLHLFMSFTTLVITYNIFSAGGVFEGIVKFLKSFVNVIFSTNPIESLESKSAIVYTILTPFETRLVVLGYVIYSLYVTLIIGGYLIKGLKARDVNTTSYGVTLAIYAILAALPLVAHGVGTDLWWRPVWALTAFASIGSTMLEGKHKPVVSRFLSTVNRGRHLLSFTALIAVTSLFLFANVIYSRVHLIPSEVYTHEASTINEFYAVISGQSILSNMHLFKIVLIDTPSAPAYEVSRALIYANVSSGIFVLFSNCNIPVYPVHYFNGVTKSRDFSLISGSLGMCIDDNSNLHAYIGDQVIIVGGEPLSLGISVILMSKSFFIGLN